MRLPTLAREAESKSIYRSLTRGIPNSDTLRLQFLGDRVP